MGSGVDIAVVIPTRNRGQVLEATLDGLAGQRLDGVRVEVVVADNGSDDGSRERLVRRAAAGADPFPLRVVDEPVPGAAAARNAGVGAADAPVVLFLGDDCRPAGPGLVAGHARSHGEGAPSAVVGHVTWDPVIERTPAMDWMERTGKWADYPRLDRDPPGPFLFVTANVSVPRAAVVAAGGFDQRFRGYGWEDFELALRLADAGVRFAYRPDLAAYHRHRYTLADSLARMEASGRSARLLNRLHADRRPLPAPRPEGLKGFGARALAPVLTRVAPPWAERDGWLRATHFAAFARGYGSAELPAHPAVRGGVPAGRAGRRPPVSVVVPFAGDEEDARALVAALARLDLADGDEVLVADNSVTGAVARVSAPAGLPLTVVPATRERSAYYARNVAATRARTDWLLFLDADCRPTAGLIAAYFAEPIPDACGAVAGTVEGAPWQEARVARYARSRRHLDQIGHLAHRFRPFAITANLLVRRAAWAAVGGFSEGIRSSGDAELCFRLQDAGWTLAHRPRAAVVHLHRERVWPLVRQMARYGAGHTWINRRYPGSFERMQLARPLARCAAGVLAWTATARYERAAFKALDAVVIASEASGQLLSNAVAREEQLAAAPPDRSVAVLVDLFPERSETFVVSEARTLRDLGWSVRVEATAQAFRPNRDVVGDLPAAYLEDAGPLRKLADMAWLLVHAPGACARDLRDRRRWRREETVMPLMSLAPCARRLHRARVRHLHAHFAAGAALNALRLGRLLGVPYSVTAHAYDIFQRPSNLREKLASAAFATSGCDYNVRHLRGVLGGNTTPIHQVVMGVDGERFARRGQHPRGLRVLAVGRLVEKKGFAHLLDAVALLPDDVPLDRVEIVGDGPLRADLERRVRELGLEGRVVLVGPSDHAGVRELLDQSALLAVPCVVAPDGDRDGIPTVVKEALAMEVPVVASDEVGLPEVVRPEWGRLVPPGDPAALAEALAELLRMPESERAEMGRRGREWVLAHADVERETLRLARLIAAE